MLLHGVVEFAVVPLVKRFVTPIPLCFVDWDYVTATRGLDLDARLGIGRDDRQVPSGSSGGQCARVVLVENGGSYIRYPVQFIPHGAEVRGDMLAYMQRT